MSDDGIDFLPIEGEQDLEHGMGQGSTRLHRQNQHRIVQKSTITRFGVDEPTPYELLRFGTMVDRTAAE